MTCANCGASSGSICPCSVVTHPWVIFNAPGQPTINYRAGDYAAVRHALLRALPGETELTQTLAGQTTQVWRPGAEGDLAVQMVEWWAYLSDIVTFYNERIATQAYLGIADLPESVNRLIQILGYRPRPGLGSSVTLAALLNTTRPVTLTEGFKIQSKPGPGQPPQVFELGAAVTLNKPDAIAARTIPKPALLLSADQTTVWLDGTVSGITAGDRMLLVNKGAASGGAISAFAWATVARTEKQKSVYGDLVTAIVFNSAVTTLPPDAAAADFALLRAARSARPWSTRPPGWTTAVITSAGIDLASVERALAPGSLALADVSVTSNRPSLDPTLVQITHYSEVVWFANGDGPSPPSGNPLPIPVPIPHTHVDFSPDLTGNWDGATSQVTLHFAFAVVGRLVALPSAAAAALTGAPAALMGALPFPPGADIPLLLEDSLGAGASSSGVTSPDQRTLTLGQLDAAPAAGLGPTLDVFFALFTATRGETVRNEALGVGDAAVKNQDFKLQKSNVTYFMDPASHSGDQFSSTVQVWVNGLQWSEVPHHFGQPANAQIFVTREDEDGKTHVVFGDGESGATLPTGATVTATYRTGSGAAAPPAGTLTNILQPQPGLKSVANPIAPVGGADPDPASKISALAPRSALTFGRAISLDDYQAIAAGAPGIVQAAATFSFDPIAQRPCVTVWVRGDAGAQASAQAAIAAAADPNRPVRVQAATDLDTVIGFTYVRDPRQQDDVVRSGLHAALLDPDHGLFGLNVIGIGQTIYDSQIYSACLAVPGVVAVEGLAVRTGPRFRPFFRPGAIVSGRRPIGMAPPCSGQRHDPGEGRFLSVPDDGQHLKFAGQVAS
jgi:hypothetical protein